MGASISRALRAGLVSSIIALSGCVGPPALRQSVMGYDETVTRLDQDILLLNIARLSQYDPPHFTVTSSIAATFNFETGGSIGGSVFEGSGTDLLSLSLESRAAENPTFSIVPVAGQDFTERILKPFNENVFAFFGFQGVRIELLGRLMADSILVNYGGQSWQQYENRITKRDEFYQFRRYLLHLGALQAQGKLWITQLTFNQTVFKSVPAVPSPSEITTGFANGLTWEDNNDGTYKLVRRVAGRILISDYDPLEKDPKELQALNDDAGRFPANFVLIDVKGRYDSPGDAFPIRGALKLRSLFSVLDFVAKSIKLYQEEAVDPDPRTHHSPADSDRNPLNTLTIVVSDERPRDARRWIEYNGQYYALGQQKWDLQAFTILYELFQVTLSDVNRIGIPVTIAK